MSGSFLFTHLEGIDNWLLNLEHTLSQPCHPEPFDTAQEKPRAGSLSAEYETLTCTKRRYGVGRVSTLPQSDMRFRF